jgi:hypothetical protein
MLSSDMGFRNYTVRAVLLLVLALGVGIAVAILSGSDRGRGVQGSSLPVIEAPADQRMAKPGIQISPHLSCPPHEGCTRL